MTRAEGPAGAVALETSGRLGSVAVALDGEVLARRLLTEQGAHAARLIPAVDEALADAGLERDEIGQVLVGGGPGSFTGVRVAAATAKGLARALGCPLKAFSSLEAAAVGPELGVGPGVLEAMDETVAAGAARPVLEPAGFDEARYVLLDARGDRVYGACYRVLEDSVSVLVEPHGGRLGEVLERDLPDGVAFAGDGALRHAATLSAAGYRILAPPAGVPLADALVHLDRLHPDHPPLAEPSRWEPSYLREWAGGRAE